MSPAPRSPVPQPTDDAPAAVVGRVSAVHRYPLKSAAGEQLDAVAVDAGGLADDRRWLLVDDAGAPVTAREAPGLRDVAVRVEGGGLRLQRPGEEAPDARPDRPRILDLERDLAAVTGRPVRLSDTGAGRTADSAAVHIVSLGAEADPDAPGGCDPEPRANLVLDLTARPGSERTWTGRRLRVGGEDSGVVLRVTRRPKRCLGVYAEVDAPGAVARGDVVTLLDG